MSVLEIVHPEEAQLVLGPGLAGALMTPQEFDAIDEVDENYNYELIHGVLVVTPPPLEEERGPNELLGNWLYLYKIGDPRGSALDETLPEHHVPTPNCRRRADRVIWAGLRRVPNPRIDFPSIIIEFVSEGKRNWLRDYREKRAEYLAAGVREYWIINRFARTMTVCLADHPDVIVSEHEVYCSPLLPGFELSLSALLAVANRWGASKEE